MATVGGRGARLSGAALSAVAVLCLTLVVYLPVLGAGFVYEDRHYLATMTGAMTPQWNLAAWSYQLQTAWTGASTRAFHVGSLIVHLVNGLLVWRVSRRWLTPVGSVAAMAIYLLHPLQVESVAYVAARPDLLSTTLVLLAVWSHEYVALWPLVGVVVYAAASTKASAVVVAPLLAWLDWRDQRYRSMAVWLSLSVAGLGWIWWQYPHMVSLAHVVPMLRYAGIQAMAIVTFAVMAVIPLGLSVDHDWIGIPMVVGTVACVAFVLGSLRSLSSRSVGWLGLGWCCLVLMPRLVVGTVYPPDPVEYLNEHQLSLAFVGVSLAMSYIVTERLTIRNEFLDQSRGSWLDVVDDNESAPPSVRQRDILGTCNNIQSSSTAVRKNRWQSLVVYIVSKCGQSMDYLLWLVHAFSDEVPYGISRQDKSRAGHHHVAIRLRDGQQRQVVRDDPTRLQRENDEDEDVVALFLSTVSDSV